MVDTIEHNEKSDRITAPCIMVIFGATGDLTKRKLFPALYNLAADPAEAHDVADIHPEIVAKMAAHMKTQHTPSAEFPFPALDRTER